LAALIADARYPLLVCTASLIYYDSHVLQLPKSNDLDHLWTEALSGRNGVCPILAVNLRPRPMSRVARKRTLSEVVLAT
jgi:hypothetical protein